LTEEQFLEAADHSSHLFPSVETTTKGPEAKLPEGFLIYDKEGVGRKEVRLQWWNGSACTWRDIAISVPDPDQLPDSNLPVSVKQSVYPEAAKPVFFGHYWFFGNPILQAHNALCLDYSAGRDGPLVSYQFESGAGSLSLEDLTIHS
jgi:hypothetical protein